MKTRLQFKENLALVFMTQMKQVQEAELKASANEREVQLLRISVRQQKEKVKQLHELLVLREQEQRYGVIVFPSQFNRDARVANMFCFNVC